jgi:hypothetical protein
VAPLVLLLAALSAFKGYTWLNVISAGGWRSSALGFAFVTFVIVVALARPLRRGQRFTAVSLVSASVVVVMTTVLAEFLGGQTVARLAGASDLLFAVAALAAVAASEHSARRPG